MKLTKEQIDITNLLTQDGIYDCCLVQQRFAYKLFNNSVSSLGDAILFYAPTKIGPLFFQNAMVVAAELPNTSMFGGTCFARLYAAQVGSILAVMLNKDCTVDESCIFIDGEQTSLSMINQVKDSVIIHLIFPLEEGNTQEAFRCVELDEEKKLGFEISVIESFRQLTRSIYIETRRDNF